MCEVLQRKQVTMETIVTLPDGSQEKQLVPINFRKLLLSRFESLSVVGKAIEFFLMQPAHKAVDAILNKYIHSCYHHWWATRLAEERLSDNVMKKV